MNGFTSANPYILTGTRRRFGLVDAIYRIDSSRNLVHVVKKYEKKAMTIDYSVSLSVKPAYLFAEKKELIARSKNRRCDRRKYRLEKTDTSVKLVRWSAID